MRSGVIVSLLIKAGDARTTHRALTEIVALNGLVKDAKAIDAIVAAMNLYEDDTEVQVAACEVLVQLSSGSNIKIANYVGYLSSSGTVNIKNYIGDAGGVSAVLRAMTGHSQPERDDWEKDLNSVACYGTTTIRALCATAENIQLLLRAEEGGVGVLLAVLARNNGPNHGRSTIAESALGALRRIAEDAGARVRRPITVDARQEIVRHAGIDLMFQTLNRFEDSLNVGINVIGILWELSAVRDYIPPMLVGTRVATIHRVNEAMGRRWVGGDPVYPDKWHMNGCQLLVRLVSDDRLTEGDPIWMQLHRDGVGLDMVFLRDSFLHFTSERHWRIKEATKRGNDLDVHLQHLPVEVLFYHLRRDPAILLYAINGAVREMRRREYVESVRRLPPSGPHVRREQSTSDDELFSSDSDDE